MSEAAENSEEISDELTTKLIHFHDVTQIDDLERCKTILQQHEWNIERAVQSTFSDPSMPSTQPLPTREAFSPSEPIGLRRRVPSPPHSLVYHHNVVPRQMIYVGGRPRRPPEGVFGWGYFLFVLPIRYGFTQVFGVIKFVFRLFFPDPRERITDPYGDVTTFISEFEAKYTNHPEFFIGTYGKAQEEAKKQIKFLLVYLHDLSNSDTEPFCQGTLCHPDVIEYINRKALFWACSVDKPEGYRVSKIVRSSSFPMLAMVCLYQNKMTVVGRLEGLATSEELIRRLSEIVEAYEPILISLRADKDARSQNILIRQEQDEAYLLSLQRDQEKMDKKKKVEEEELKIKVEKEQLLQEKEMKVEMCRQRKARCKEEILPEPEDSCETALNLVIKLPDGTRLKRRFNGSDTVKTLHDYIYAQDGAPAYFQVFSNFPRKPIPGCCSDDVDSPGGSTPFLCDIGLGRNDTLFVQALHQSDDEDDSDESSDLENVGKR